MGRWLLVHFTGETPLSCLLHLLLELRMSVIGVRDLRLGDDCRLVLLGLVVVKRVLVLPISRVKHLRLIGRWLVNVIWWKLFFELQSRLWVVTDQIATLFELLWTECYCLCLFVHRHHFDLVLRRNHRGLALWSNVSNLPISRLRSWTRRGLYWDHVDATAVLAVVTHRIIVTLFGHW